MRELLGIACFALLVIPGCDRKSADSTKDEPSEEGVPVDRYCKKMVKLGEDVAAANGGKAAEGEPSRDQQIAFCTAFIGNAKSKEPKAYACMADCMMAADTREEEQTCIAEKKCLSKAKNKKLFSNRAD